MRIAATITDPIVVNEILGQLGVRTELPLRARAPDPTGEMDFGPRADRRQPGIRPPARDRRRQLFFDVTDQVVDAFW